MRSWLERLGARCIGSAHVLTFVGGCCLPVSVRIKIPTETSPKSMTQVGQHAARLLQVTAELVQKCMFTQRGAHRRVGFNWVGRGCSSDGVAARSSVHERLDRHNEITQQNHCHDRLHGDCPWAFDLVAGD